MKGMPEDEKLFTFEEAMEYLRVSRSTLYTFMSNKWIQGHKIGRTWRFYLGDLRSFVNKPNAVEEAPLIDEHT